MKLITTISAFLAAAASSYGAITVTFQEIGSDVIVTASGSIDFTGAGAPTSSSIFSSFVTPSSASAFVRAGNPVDNYSAASAFTSQPSSIGTGSFTAASSSSGDSFAINAFGIFVPSGYSGGPISSSSTFSDTDFSTLGLTPGAYTWNFVSGDTATVNVGSIPEPSSMILLGFGTLFVVGRRKRNK